MSRSLLILLGVLVVLLIVYLIVNSARDVTYQPEAFLKIDTTEVSGFSITNEHGTIKLRKSGGIWRLAEPVDYPAEARFVDDLMKKIGAMEIETMISRDPEKASMFEVDTAGVEVAVLAGADTLGQFIVGKMSDNYSNTYCRKIGEDTIYLIRGTFTGQLKRQAKDWRDKVILEMDKALISRLDFQYPRETFSLAKHDTVWALEFKGKEVPAMDKMVDRTLSVISRFRAYDFVDGDSAKMVDFSVPELALTISTEAGDQYRLAFVPQDVEENRYLVRKSGVENTLFVIYKGSANSIMKHAEDFEMKEEEKEKA